MRIVDMFKTIITVKDPNLQEYALRDAWRRLNSGVLEEHLLRHLWKQFNFSSKTFDFFIYLMQKFGLVCEKKTQMGDERVFYVLSRLKPERVLSPPTENRNCAVSIFHDFSGYLPDDLFQRGVTKFIEKFQVEDNEPKLSYEHVELYIGKLHHVVLNVATIKNRRMFQTTIIRLNISNADQLSREDEPSPTVCKKVLDFLKTGLKNFSQKGARGVGLTMYIPCVCCPNGDAHMHIVRTFDKNVLPCGSRGMEMTRYNRLFGDSMPMQAVPPSHVAVNKPEAPEDYVDDVTIETVSEKIGLRRKKFGVRLGLSWSEVNKFNTHKGEEAVKNMMWYWRSKMQSRMQHQLKSLCVALGHYGFKTFADSLFKGDTESIVIEEQAEQDCFSDQDLLFICDNLPIGWRKLARQLGFEQAVIDDIITYNHQWESDSNMHMLAIWKMGHSEKQMPIMIKALKKTGFDQVAERVCERHDYNDKAVYQNNCRPQVWVDDLIETSYMSLRTV
ncbi:uncharacterized protein LOC117113731 [Anneissia japonica]|uniref:uncharacterized protein LOC117113731 n=1 Tax=Anneissia japonica TaxID=1529436 RepID=UPI0014258B21|nr:uncharacterized protein LOC117113731 [Anneissia japonica]